MISKKPQESDVTKMATRSFLISFMLIRTSNQEQDTTKRILEYGGEDETLPCTSRPRWTALEE